MPHSKAPLIFTCGLEKPQYDMVFIAGPGQHDYLAKLKAKAESSGLSCCFVGDGSKDGYLTPEQVNTALEGKIDANTNVVILGHGIILSNQHYIKVYKNREHSRTDIIIDQLCKIFSVDARNAEEKLNVDIYSCRAGAVQCNRNGIRLALHGSHEHVVLSSETGELISKFIARKQHTTIKTPYEDFIYRIITSPETCIYSEDSYRFRATAASEALSTDLRRYLENSIKGFLEFRRDKLGHKIGDIDTEIIRLKASIFGASRHEGEAYNTEKEADSLKRYQELAMIMCCNRGDSSLYLFGSLENGVDMNARLENGATALLTASHKGRKDIAELLLEKGANPNLARTDDGITPLFMACQNGYEDIAKLLLAKGADPNLATTDDGATALYTACQNGHNGVVKLLLANGVNIIAGLYNSFTPLMVAALCGHEEVVQLLLNTIEDTDTLTRTADKNKAEEFCKSRNITMPDSYRAFLGKTAMEMAKTPKIAKMIEDRINELRAKECFVESKHTRMLMREELVLHAPPKFYYNTSSLQYSAILTTFDFPGY